MGKSWGNEEWGVDADSTLRRGTRDLVRQCLANIDKNLVSVEDAAASISARILNITAKELEVDWYRAQGDAILVDLEEHEVDPDFDPRRSDDVCPSLREEGIELDFQFSTVHFPEADDPSEDELQKRSNDLSDGGLSSAGEAEAIFMDVMDVIALLDKTPEEVITASFMPHKRGLEVDELRQILYVIPPSHVLMSFRRSRGQAERRCREFFRRFARFPYIRETIEAGIAIMTFERDVKEATDVLSKYSKIANEIAESEKLAFVLRAGLRLFNKVLLKEGEQGAEGFSLDILSTLKTEVSPNEPEKSLLSVLTRSVLKAAPGMLPIDDMPTMASEMISLPLLEDVETLVAELYNNLEGVVELSQLGDADDPFVVDVCNFLSGRKGGKKLRSTLISMHGVLRVSLQKMMMYFGEENVNSRQRQMHIIVTIWNFTRDLEMAVMQARIGDLKGRLSKGVS